MSCPNVTRLVKDTANTSHSPFEIPFYGADSMVGRRKKMKPQADHFFPPKQHEVSLSYRVNSNMGHQFQFTEVQRKQLAWLSAFERCGAMKSI